MKCRLLTDCGGAAVSTPTLTSAGRLAARNSNGVSGSGVKTGV
ncbi:MAG: hypothetical protein U1F83_03425 [Verrucomicrobiota bacterium]